MKKSVLLFVFPLLICLLAVGCSSKSKDKLLQEAMEKEAAVLNSQCPIRDGSLILNSCEVLADKTFRYNYTLLDPSIAQDTIAAAVENKAIMLNLINNNPVMNEYKQSGVSFSYYFETKDGKHIYSFRIGPEDYVR